MAKTNSKNVVKKTTKSKKIFEKRNRLKPVENSKFVVFFTTFLQKIKLPFIRLKNWIHDTRSRHYHPHKSFKRSYKEDYQRESAAPGLLEHAVTTFKVFFSHWKTFLPFILIMSVGYVVFVGLLSEETYQSYQDSIDETAIELGNGDIGNFAKAGLLLLSTVTSGGLSSDNDEVGTVFIVLLFLIMWLVTIYLVRHYQSGQKPKLRDALYNALAPLISTLIVLVVVVIQCIPLILVAITYSAAVATEFLATPFYALVYFIFVVAMLLLSGYLLSSSVIALVAVTAPGVYPMAALAAASDLIMSRRLRLIARMLYLVVVLAIVYIVVMLPIILLDLWLKSIFDWLVGCPIVPFFLMMMTCFSFIYLAIYLYRYYRWLLDYQEK